MKASSLLLTKYFRQFIQASSNGRRSSASGRRISKGTISNYIYALRLLHEFESHHAIELRIQLLHRASMRVLQKEKNYWNRFFRNFSNFLYNNKKYLDHYTMNVFKSIKTFFNWLQNEKGYVTGCYHRSFRIPIQDAVPVVLLPEQLRYLVTNSEFESKLNGSQKRSRDIFVFGCAAGLRFSDLMQLKKTHLQTWNGETLLTLFTQKTGMAVRIPLPQYAMLIVERYKTRAGKYILPRLSNTNFNLQIKRLGQLAGWSQALPKMRSHRGKMMEIKKKNGDTWKFFEHITAHTMRRTAITNLLILGVPEPIVRKISGHAAGSREFYKYVNIADGYLNDEVKKAYKKLMEPSNSSPKSDDAKPIFI